MTDEGVSHWQSALIVPSKLKRKLQGNIELKLPWFVGESNVTDSWPPSVENTTDKSSGGGGTTMVGDCVGCGEGAETPEGAAVGRVG